MVQPNQNGASSETADVEEERQSFSEGRHATSRTDPSEHSMQPADERAALNGDDARVVKAVHVSMARSGAELIEAQRVTLENSGAKSMTTHTAELINSGALRLNADEAVFNKSSALLVRAREMRIEQSKVGIAASTQFEVHGAGQMGMLVSRNVAATGDVNGTVMIAGNVTAGGDVNVTFNAVSAGVLGAVFAATLYGLRRLFDR